MLDAGHDMSVHVHLRENQRNSRSADSVRLCVANEVPLVGVIFPSIMQSRIISCVLRDLSSRDCLSVWRGRQDVTASAAHRGSTHENGAITPCLIMHVYFRLRTRTVRHVSEVSHADMSSAFSRSSSASSGFLPSALLVPSVTVHIRAWT